MSAIESNNNVARLQAMPKGDATSNNNASQERNPGNREIHYPIKQPLDSFIKAAGKNDNVSKKFQDALSKADVANNSQKFKLAQAMNQLKSKLGDKANQGIKLPGNDRIKSNSNHQVSNISGKQQGKGLGPGPKRLNGAQERALKQLAGKPDPNLGKKLAEMAKPNTDRNKIDQPRLDQGSIEHILRQAKQNDLGAMQRALEVRRAMEQFQ